ncbi:MAG: redoxin domain-containing protein, partial [Myxococcales bacterium]|nr:redoxin domain-containing protein [Myxococcales bacterium]
MAKPKDLNSIPSVEAIMAKGSGPAVIDFWAPWCAPCRAMAPQFEAVAQHYEGQPVRFYKINTEAHPE